jgi:hypothetical protein
MPSTVLTPDVGNLNASGAWLAKLKELLGRFGPQTRPPLPPSKPLDTYPTPDELPDPNADLFGPPDYAERYPAQAARPAVSGLRSAAAPAITSSGDNAYFGRGNLRPDQQVAAGQRANLNRYEYQNALDRNLFDAQLRAAGEGGDTLIKEQMPQIIAAQAARPRRERPDTSTLDAMEGGDASRGNALLNARSADEVYQAGRGADWNKFVDTLNQQQNPRYRDIEEWRSNLRANENAYRGYGSSGMADFAGLGGLLGIGSPGVSSTGQPQQATTEDNVVTQQQVMELAQATRRSPDEIAASLQRRGIIIR